MNAAGQNGACAKARTHMDAYLSRELPEPDRRELAGHLEACPLCAADLETRTRLRAQLQAAVRSAPVPPALEGRVRRAVRDEGPPHRTGLWAIAAAAAVIACVALVSYVRQRANPENAILAKTSGPLAAVLKVGLRDHLQCAVFRKYAKRPEAANEMAADLGPGFATLAPLVKAKLPAGFFIVSAHHCTADGRHYTHFIIAAAGKLISLVLTRAKPGESMGGGIYQTGVDRFQVVGFESHGYLAYVISDLDAEQNLQLAASLAPSVREFLATHAG